jgi:hypothetical protein
VTEQDLIHKIEWVNKRCSLKGEPLTQSQIELLMFVFADTVVNKNFALADVSRRANTDEYTKGYRDGWRDCCKDQKEFD